MPTICRSWQYSKFYAQPSYQESLQKAESQNNERVEAATKILSEIDSKKTLQLYNSLLQKERVDLAIVVITTERKYKGKSLQYLLQTVTEVHQQLQQSKDLNTTTFQICDVQRGLNADAEKLSKYFPVIKRFRDSRSSKMSSLEMASLYVKETRDYAFCLSKASQGSVRYVLMLEDDAVPRKNMINILKDILTYKVNKRNSVKDNWFYINLFHPRRWKGYSKDIDDNGILLRRGIFLAIVEITSLSLLISILLFAILSKIMNQITRKYYLEIFLSSFVYVAVLLFTIGRAHIIELFSFHPALYKVFSPALGCCTPAVLFSQKHTHRFVGHLSDLVENRTGMEPIDILMARYAEANGLRTYGVEPNLVKHIGMVSSVKSRTRFFPTYFID